MRDSVPIARDIQAFVMYWSMEHLARSSLLIESTDSMIIIIYSTYRVYTIFILYILYTLHIYIYIYI